MPGLETGPAVPPMQVVSSDPFEFRLGNRDPFKG